MVTIEFIPQSGQNTASPKISPSAINDKGMLTALLNEAADKGRVLELISHEHDNDTNAFVKSMTFGIGADSKQTGIIDDTVFPTFFASGRLFTHLIVTNNTATAIQISGGTTSGGFELFTSESISANQVKAIPLAGAYGLSTSAVTAFYIHHAGVDDTWNSIIAPGIDIKTVSEAI
jgi:hypothetical protein